MRVYKWKEIFVLHAAIFNVTIDFITVIVINIQINKIFFYFRINCINSLYMQK